MNMRKLTILAMGVLLGSLVTAPVLLAHPPDSDGDGIRDPKDRCLFSDLSPDVIIDTCAPGVQNFLDSHGCTIMDAVDDCAALATSHNEFVNCVGAATRTLRNSNIITTPEKVAIDACAKQADIP
jgi:hypothetical protein